MDFGTAFSSVMENIKQVNLLENTIYVALCVLTALGLGLLVTLFYGVVNRGVNFTFEFTLTLIAVSGVIALIISVIGTNLASAFSLAGLMSIVRFRSLQQKSSDIAFIFISMGAGVACGMGLIVPGLVFVLVIGIIIDVYTLLSIGFRKESRLLKICVPEAASFDKQFDDVLSKHTASYDLRRVRLISAGTVLEISYAIAIPRGAKMETMLSEIRERNSNFNVVITYIEDVAETN